ncbi:hypothetical protein M569_11824, partial [Genlisea aurea]
METIGAPNPDASTEESEVQIYLHSNVLRRSKYFSALLSDRWKEPSDPISVGFRNESGGIRQFNFHLPAGPDSLDFHLTVLKLLCTEDVLPAIQSVTAALNILPIALQLLFEDCVKACVKFLEAVPWSEEEESKLLTLIPLMSCEEAMELLQRVSPTRGISSEEMLRGLIHTATHNHPNMALAKAFVANILRDFSSRESVMRVLDSAFELSLRAVKLSLEEYTSPDFRGDHNETEAMQRVHLHTAATSGKHLLWLIERMIELKVANTGNIIAPTQVRMKLVNEWLPVLILCKDSDSTMGPSHKTLYLELEETFLRIISTLPLSAAQELLQRCLSFSTRNLDDCRHLVAAFTTWFR